MIDCFELDVVVALVWVIFMSLLLSWIEGVLVENVVFIVVTMLELLLVLTIVWPLVPKELLFYDIFT